MSLIKPKPEQVCPHCLTPMGLKVKPERGMVFVCHTCTRPSVFAGTFRAEIPAELVRNLRDEGYVLARAEAMFRGDPEFHELWDRIVALEVRP